MDLLFARGLIRASSPEELWALARAVGRNVIADRIAEVQRLPIRSGALLQGLSDPQAGTGAEESGELLDRVMGSVGAGTDRDLLFLSLRGASGREAAAATDAGEAAVRQRWARLCRGLRGRFGRRD